MTTTATKVQDQSGRPDGGILMPPWKHYKPAPEPIDWKAAEQDAARHVSGLMNPRRAMFA